nr:Omp28-related outer membrane protein [Bacteroidia bacterium]
MTNTELAKTATCGIAIDATAITGTTGKVKVRVGFGADMTGGLNVSVYVLENKVTGTGSGYDQRNFIANRPGFEDHPFFTQPGTIAGYMHNHVLRNVLSASFGDVIDVTKQVKGGIFEKEYDVNLAGLNPANVEIVALVHRAGNTSADMAVMNAQLVKVGENKAWD